MRKLITGILSVLLCICLAVPAAGAAQYDDIHTQILETRDALSGLIAKDRGVLEQGENGSAISDWCVMALALCESPEDYEAHLQALQAYVVRTYEEEGKLDRVKATPYHRITLAALALGGDPEHFGRTADGDEIDLVADGTYAFWGDSIGAQGLNGWIYALLALDASGASVPADAKFSREEMLQTIVSAQEPDGSFGLAAGKPDVDVTAMALQALAPYRDAYPSVISEALDYLAAAMNPDGTFTVYGEECAETSAQVVLALCALGIDPETDGRFMKDGATLLTGLDTFRLTDGTYGHLQNAKEMNYLATAQSLLALRALEKMRGGAGWIYDFTDYPGPVQRESTDFGMGAAIVCAAALAAAAFWFLRKKQRKEIL